MLTWWLELAVFLGLGLAQVLRVDMISLTIQKFTSITLKRLTLLTWIDKDKQNKKQDSIQQKLNRISMYNDHIHKTILNRQMYNPKDVSSKYTKSQKRWCQKCTKLAAYSLL